jgi:hypothetical protein
MPAADGASTAVGCADSGLSLDGGHQDGQNGRRRMSGRLGRLGRLGAALHDSATVREFGSKLMRAPGLTVYMQWPGSSTAMPSFVSSWTPGHIGDTMSSSLGRHAREHPATGLSVRGHAAHAQSAPGKRGGGKRGP